ncbi:hypothetical protein [Thermoflexus sp.]|uniref:hypothetical protein n=1 Tax=Thermoflexus sp. TaxID=1969742 RepID=UPI002ADDB861|nr:hypothetical protein [Thermoflexus sp.]
MEMAPWQMAGEAIYRLSVVGLVVVTLVMMFLTAVRLITELFSFTELVPVPAEEDEGGRDGRRVVQRTVYQIPHVSVWLRIVFPAMVLAAIFVGFFLSPMFPPVMPALFPTDSGTGEGLRTWISVQEIVSERIEGLIRSILSLIGGETT